MMERTIIITEDNGLYTIMDYTDGVRMIANERHRTVAMDKLEVYLGMVEK